MIAHHRATMAVGILVSLLALAAGAADDKPAEPKGKGGLAKLQGAWADEERVWVIAGDEVLIYGRSKEQISRGKIRVDTTKRPNQIDLTFSRYRPDHGIYEVKGDTLRVCVTPKEMPRPTEFESNGKTVALWVFKRRAPAKASAGMVQQTFYDNEALADETYTDRLVTVTGVIRRIRRGDVGYVLLVSQTAGDKPDFILQFDFPTRARSQLAKLKNGEKVTVQGLCRGSGKGESGKDAVLFLGSTIVAAKE